MTNGLRDLKAIERQIEQNDRLKDFLTLAGTIMVTRDLSAAAAKAEAIGASERVRRVLKDASAGGTTANAGADFATLFAAFIDSARVVGVFDLIAQYALRVPLRPGRILINTTAIVASSVAEGKAKPVRALSLAPEDLSPIKAIAQVVLSRTLIDALDTAGINALGRELRAAVAVGTDGAALTNLTTTNTADASNTGTWETYLADLEELAHLVRLGSASRAFYVTTPAIAKTLARAAWQNGVEAVGLNGGEILGVPLLVSDGQGAGKVSLIDATGIAIAERPIELRSSDQASVEMSDAPSGASDTPTATSLVSMYQTNSRALLAERQMALALVRDTAVATLTGFGPGTDSPAGF